MPVLSRVVGGRRLAVGAPVGEDEDLVEFRMPIERLRGVIIQLAEVAREVGPHDETGRDHRDEQKHRAPPQAPGEAARAAKLSKCDLLSAMVGEFPELQGLMGRYYAEAEKMNPKIAAAIEEHYKPLGPSDRVPLDPVSVAVALADKIDTLVGFFEWERQLPQTIELNMELAIPDNRAGRSDRAADFRRLALWFTECGTEAEAQQVLCGDAGQRLQRRRGRRHPRRGGP
mgnify:CR=1 FL=1